MFADGLAPFSEYASTVMTKFRSGIFMRPEPIFTFTYSPIPTSSRIWLTATWQKVSTAGIKVSNSNFRQNNVEINVKRIMVTQKFWVIKQIYRWKSERLCYLQCGSVALNHLYVKVTRVYSLYIFAYMHDIRFTFLFNSIPLFIFPDDEMIQWTVCNGRIPGLCKNT